MWGEECGLLCFVLFSVALCRWHEVFISMAFETKRSPRRRARLGLSFNLFFNKF